MENSFGAKGGKKERGFTIIELVIVIAVIAILAAVLIPTFTNVINSANETVAMQSCRNEWANFFEKVTAGDSSDINYLLSYNEANKTEDTIADTADTSNAANYVVLERNFDPDNEYSVTATGSATISKSNDSYSCSISGTSYTVANTYGNDTAYQYGDSATTVYTVTIGDSFYLLGAKSVSAADSEYSKEVSNVAIYKLYKLTGT